MNTASRPNPKYWEAVRKGNHGCPDQTAGLALFDSLAPGVPRTLPDPRTKEESFQSLDRTVITEQQQLVLGAIAEHGPITDQDLAKITKLPLASINGRRHELFELGRITLHDKVRSEETGRSRARWRIV